MKLISLILIGLWFFIGDSQAQSFLDTTFNHTGIIKNDTGRCYKIRIQPDNKILTQLAHYSGGKYLLLGISFFLSSDLCTTDFRLVIGWCFIFNTS